MSLYVHVIFLKLICLVFPIRETSTICPFQLQIESRLIINEGKASFRINRSAVLYDCHSLFPII